MKNNKGITLVSVIIYLIVLGIVIGVVSGLLPLIPSLVVLVPFTISTGYRTLDTIYNKKHFWGKNIFDRIDCDSEEGQALCKERGITRKS